MGQRNDNPTILGIESTCDDSAVAVVNSKKDILFNEVYSQVNEHRMYGGVVPEIAARNHIEILPNIISNGILSGKIDFNKIDAIAVTAGPGLIGGVIVGVMIAKSMAAVLNKPCIPINHLAAHALTIRFTEDVDFPYLSLLISGGHCQIMIVESSIKYKILGQTLDDAVGESFDKVAKMLELEHLSGAMIERIARDFNGDKYAFKFPKPLYKQNNCNFSFSGLKTAVHNVIKKLRADNLLNEQIKADICASFQHTIAEILEDRLVQSIKYSEMYIDTNNTCSIKSVVISGGVSANQYIREYLSNVLKNLGLNLYVSPIELCTDNAVMIAWNGVEILKRYNMDYELFRNLDFAPKSRWNLNNY